MGQWIRSHLSHLTYANVVATLSLFLVLAGGTAAAVTYVVSSNSQVGPNTISGHAPPTGKHANVIGGSVNGNDVANNSLTGGNINESSLARVPSATSAILGGTGRSSSGNDQCNPESPDVVNCALVSITVPTSSNILITGQATVTGDHSTSPAFGYCRLGSASHGPVPGSSVSTFAPEGGYAPVTTTRVWGPFPAGTYTFGLDCSDDFNASYSSAGVSAVALSGN